jgi:hypothetical protein
MDINITDKSPISPSSTDKNMPKLLGRTLWPGFEPEFEPEFSLLCDLISSGLPLQLEPKKILLIKK